MCFKRRSPKILLREFLVKHHIIINQIIFNILHIVYIRLNFLLYIILCDRNFEAWFSRLQSVEFLSVWEPTGNYYSQHNRPPEGDFPRWFHNGVVKLRILKSKGGNPWRSENEIGAHPQNSHISRDPILRHIFRQSSLFEFIFIIITFINNYYNYIFRNGPINCPRTSDMKFAHFPESWDCNIYHNYVIKSSTGTDSSYNKYLFFTAIYYKVNNKSFPQVYRLVLLGRIQEGKFCDLFHLRLIPRF